MTAPVTRAVESRDPATGEVWRTFEAADGAAVAAAVARARGAQPGWSAVPLAERAALLLRFHDALYRRRAEVARIITRENGKPTIEALGAEILMVLDQSRFFARVARRELAPSRWRRAASLAMWRKRVRVEHVAHGVVAVVSPWNYPFMLAAGVILPALVAGNTIVHKPSEFTPSTGLILDELLAEAGAPPGVMTTLAGDGGTGAALVDAAVDKVFFTGSVATGRRVAVRCAERLIPCSLELGGSDPAIVLEDADIANAASGIAWGRFSNAGQTCVAPKRVFVVGAAYEPFVASLAHAVRSLRGGAGEGDATEVASLVRPDQGRQLRAQLEDALARGARVAAVAPEPAHAPDEGWMPPTVLVDVPPEARVLTEETFGPLLPVVRVTTAAEAVTRANASAFGLSASVWSRSVARAVAVAERLEAGTVSINDSLIVAGMADVPHGGVKSSGMGRSHGVEGLMECVRTRAIVSDWFTARQPWWFGYGGETTRNIDAFLRVAHGGGLRERAAGVGRTMKLLFRPERPV